MGQGPGTEVTHLGLNQPPVFSSVVFGRQNESRRNEMILPHSYTNL